MVRRAGLESASSCSGVLFYGAAMCYRVFADVVKKPMNAGYGSHLLLYCAHT